MDKAVIIGVPPERVSECWPIVRDNIATALKNGGGEIGIDHVEELAKNGGMSLWLIEAAGKIAGCMVTAIHKNVLTVVALAGAEMGLWLGELIGFLKGFAGQSGCAMIKCHGRSGWERELKKYGWSRLYITMGLEV